MYMLTTPRFVVRFGSRDELRQARDRELRFGGGFVKATESPPVFSAVIVDFELPSGPQVEVPGKVVNVRDGGFFVQFDPGMELEALHSAVSFVTEVGLTPPPFDVDDSDVRKDPEPEPERGFDFQSAGDDLDDLDLDDLDDLEPDAQARTAALSGPVRPAWELIDLGSDVPLHKQIKDLTVAEKTRLARHATQPVRRILIRDTEKRIHVEIVKNPKVGLDELTEYSALASISPLALRWISKQKRLCRIKAVVNNLVQNPACPSDIALRMLATLTTTELQRVARSSRVRENISRAAKKKLMDSGVL